MAVKHKPTGVVHVGIKGEITGCGVNTDVRTFHWINTHEKITCTKNGCK